MSHFIFILAFSLFVGIGAQAESVALTAQFSSARRAPGVSYKAYTARAKTLAQQRQGQQGQQGQHGPLLQDAKSAVESAHAFSAGDLAAATTWESSAQMQERFEQVRDLRFLNDGQHSGLRRSTWLYPDDGCFARAGLMMRNLFASKVRLPKKVFVFGDLTVNTPNAENGSVSWWYHVAPIVEVSGEKYVLDPAIEPHHPLPLAQWLATMSTTPQNLEVAICDSGSYTPYDACAHESDGVEAEAMKDQFYFLGEEWQRLLLLNRDPEKELGENPPWS